jgi:hypothetical protein
MSKPSTGHIDHDVGLGAVGPSVALGAKSQATMVGRFFGNTKKCFLHIITIGFKLIVTGYRTIRHQTRPVIIFCWGNKFKQPEKAEKKDCKKKQLPDMSPESSL